MMLPMMMLSYWDNPFSGFYVSFNLLLHHFGKENDSRNPKPPGLVGSLDDENCSQHVIFFVGAKGLGEGKGTSQRNLEHFG